MRQLLTFTLLVVCGLSLGYILGQRSPAPVVRCRCYPSRMPALGCDCGEDCPCEREGQCSKPSTCPNIHARDVRPSLN